MTTYEGTSGDQTNKGGSPQWPPYHWLESPEIKPIVDDFWNVKYDENDLAMYNRFIEILRLSKNGKNGEEIGRTLNMSNVRKYIVGTKKSFLTHIRAERDRLGAPEALHRWLPLHLKPRGTPDVTWIQVPVSPLHFQDIDALVHRTSQAAINVQLLTDFGFNSAQELQQQRTNLFGFLLGAVVGDFGKHPKGATNFSSRGLSLVLSTNKPNSYRFGQFSSICANASLDLGMHRIENAPISDGRYGKSECYAWISKASPIISWIFNECLGLHDGESTTYDPLRMDWLLEAPREFIAHFFQGLAESDGWTDAGDDDVKVVSSPNTLLFQRLLSMVGCPSYVVKQQVDLLRCDTIDAIKLPFFSPRIHSNLYEAMQILSAAQRFPERLKLPQHIIDIIRELSKTTDNANQICLELAKRTGYKVSNQTVLKYIKQ